MSVAAQEKTSRYPLSDAGNVSLRSAHFEGNARMEQN